MRSKQCHHHHQSFQGRRRVTVSLNAVVRAVLPPLAGSERRFNKKIRWCAIRVSQKNTFFKKIKSGTHHASAWGLVWLDPKGFLILTKFKAAPSHLKFELFLYIGGGGGGGSSGITVPQIHMAHYATAAQLFQLLAALRHVQKERAIVQF